MNDVPRQKLREIVDQYGQTIIDNPRLCRALLLDFCGEYRREIFVLVSAQEEQVANDLQEIPDSVPQVVLVAQLAQRLVDNRALDADAARWAVESWAFALGIQIKPRHEPERAAAAAATASPKPPAKVAPSAKTTSAVKTSPAKDEFAADWNVQVFGRPQAIPDARWDRLGETPGSVKVPSGYVLGLRLDARGDELAGWARELRRPADVVSLALLGKVTDAGLAALRVFNNLTYLEIDNAEKLTDAGMAHLTNLTGLITLNLKWCTGITDEGLSPLRALPALTNLSIAWSNITDAGLVYLEALTALSGLSLRECKRINGDGLVHLKPLPRLTSLDLAGNAQLTDAGLRHLEALTGLTKLDLSRCPLITREGIVHLRSLINLTYVDLASNEAVGDAELATLCDLPRLSSLNLSRTRITDKGLSHVSDIASLIYLDVSRCDQITDVGLYELRRLTKLAYLTLSGCKRITPRGIAKLKSQRPELYVSR